MSETIIGRCSLCSGDVVKPNESDAINAFRFIPPGGLQARCRSCGATEAPPDRVIEMRKPPTLDHNRHLEEIRRAYENSVNKRGIADAIGQQFMPPAKPCPHCGPILMGSLTQRDESKTFYADPNGTQFASHL